MLKKQKFGHYELQYDTIIDHDAYEHLRVTLEVPRGQVDEAIVLLNGKEIGRINIVRQGKKIIGYQAYRFYHANEELILNSPLHTPFKHIGRAAAAIITNYVQ